MRRALHSQEGFTLVESLVAMIVTVIGLMGAVTMLDRANTTTARTQAREQATTLARDLVERTHGISYASLATTTSGSLATALRASMSTETTSNGATANSFTLVRGGITYTVTATACKIDDPTDGVGPVDSSYCTTGTSNPGSTGTGAYTQCTAANLTIVGIPLGTTACGSVANAVCALAGQSSTLNSLLGLTNGVTSLVGTGADIRVCPSTGSSIALDQNPDDMTRISVSIAWTDSGRGSTVTQAALIQDPVS
jgi:prepilin-type N-terminal cleavage/methylation domain-containing protein